MPETKEQLSFRPPQDLSEYLIEVLIAIKVPLPTSLAIFPVFWLSYLAL